MYKCVINIWTKKNTLQLAIGETQTKLKICQMINITGATISHSSNPHRQCSLFV